MQVKLIRSLSLPKGVPVPQFDTVAEFMSHMNNDEAKAVEIPNKYGRQKDSLVNARDFLSAVVATGVGKSYEADGKKFDGLGFVIIDRKTKQPLTGDAKKDDPETESDHLDRFAASVAAGKFTVKGFTATGKDDKEKVKSVWGLLQTIIDAHGPFPFDLKQATRVGKPKNPPKFAIDAAISIINGGAERVKDWTKRFTEGYESKGYGFVEPIEFSAFNQVAPKGATAEVIEATRQSNINNLAWAIANAEEQKRANTAKKEYV